MMERKERPELVEVLVLDGKGDEDGKEDEGLGRMEEQGEGLLVSEQLLEAAERGKRRENRD